MTKRVQAQMDSMVDSTRPSKKRSNASQTISSNRKETVQTQRTQQEMADQSI